MNHDNPDLTFTLQNLPKIHPYNAAQYNATTFDNRIFIVRTWIRDCKMRIEQILAEGRAASESNVAWANRLKAVRIELSVHRRVQQLLYAAMYAETYDLTGDAYVSDSASDSDM